MNKTMEKEYKWRADELLLNRALLWASSRIGSQSRTIRMESSYFDTADGMLRNKKAALRLRRENERTVCCMKLRGEEESTDGLRTRGISVRCRYARRRSAAAARKGRARGAVRRTAARGAQGNLHGLVPPLRRAAPGAGYGLRACARQGRAVPRGSERAAVRNRAGICRRRRKGVPCSCCRAGRPARPCPRERKASSREP